MFFFVANKMCKEGDRVFIIPRLLPWKRKNDNQTWKKRNYGKTNWRY